MAAKIVPMIHAQFLIAGFAKKMEVTEGYAALADMQQYVHEELLIDELRVVFTNVESGPAVLVIGGYATEFSVDELRDHVKGIKIAARKAKVKLTEVKVDKVPTEDEIAALAELEKEAKIAARKASRKPKAEPAAETPKPARAKKAKAEPAARAKRGTAEVATPSTKAGKAKAAPKAAKVARTKK